MGDGPDHRQPQANVIGYCIGGTLVAVTADYLRKTGHDLIQSATFFTTRPIFMILASWPFTPVLTMPRKFMIEFAKSGVFWMAHFWLRHSVSCARVI